MTTIPDVEPPDTKSDFDSPPICFYCYDLIRYSAFSENDAGAMYITLLQRSLHPNLHVNDADTPYHSTNTRIWKCRVIFHTPYDTRSQRNDILSYHDTR